MTPAATKVSRLVSQPRRPPGTGTITKRDGGWLVIVRLRDGSRKVRRSWSYEDAELVAARLIDEYRDQLGYHFQQSERRGLQWMYRDAQPRARNGVTPKVRFQVFERDGFRCVYCGATPKTAQLHVDHVVPVVRGGTDHPSNLATACADCNQGKSDLLIQDGATA